MGTVEKAADLLFCLSRITGPASLADLASASGLPKPSVHRLLRSLTNKRLVARDGRGRYALGAGLVTLGLCASSGDALLRSARAPLRDAAGSLGETFFLVTPQAGELRVVGKSEGTGFLRASPQVGSPLPAHATAVGQLFLALAPTQLQLPRELAQYTRRTKTAQALQRSVKRVARQGHAVSRGEWCEGLAAVAAPVRIYGEVLAAVAMACSEAQLDRIGETRAVSAVLATAAQLSDKR